MSFAISSTSSWRVPTKPCTETFIVCPPDPVIMLTASADVNHVREASGLGIQGYMLKSAFSLGEMIKKVEELIGAPAVFTHQ